MLVSYNRHLQKPLESFFLLGLRGVGKTSWAKSNLPQARWFNFLDEGLFQRFLQNPGLFGAELNRIAPESWIVVDEIQRLPNLLNEVHRGIEEKKLKFALLGSSARKLRREGTNLLAGRALWKEMYPLLPTELGQDFNFDRALQFGTLPIVLSSEDCTQKLESYVQVYLKEEIQVEAAVRNLPGFMRFLPVAAICHGQVLNISNIARDAGVARSTVEGYLQILEDTLLAYRLPPFEGRLRVKEKRHPKWYWIDSGIMRAAKRSFGEPVPEEKGHLMEGLVGMLLRAYRSLNRDLYDDCYYWASGGSGPEVDFLFSRENKFIALEVKCSINLRPEYFSGLEAIKDLKGLERRILIYAGQRSFNTNEGVEVLSLEEFIVLLANKKL